MHKMMEDNKWREKCFSLTEEHLYMIEHEIDTDCKIIVYENTNNSSQEAEPVLIKAHKHLLKSASPVFNAMFSGEYIEKANNEIKITDIRPIVMKGFIRLIYGMEQIPDNFKLTEIIELIMAAVKYDITRIIRKVYNHLKRHHFNLKDIFCIKRNLCGNITAPIIETIKKDVLKFIANETKDYLALEEALEMTKEDVVEIVTADNLSLNDESELIEFVNNWATYQLKKNSLEDTRDNLQNLLRENILPYLRVLTLTPELYYKTIDNYKWLSPDEKHSILKYITIKNSDNLPIYICNSTDTRCLLKIIAVQIPRGDPILKSPMIISSVYFITENDLVLNGIQVESKIKLFSFDDYITYDESLSIIISSHLYKNTGTREWQKLLNYTFKGTSEYNSYINVYFNDMAVEISNSLYYRIEIISNKNGYYIQAENIFDNADSFTITTKFGVVTLFKKCSDNRTSLRPSMISKLRFSKPDKNDKMHL